MTDVSHSDYVRAARKAQHDALLLEVEKRRVANADNFDKAILTYSSAGLALSLGFLKDFVPISEARCAIFLYASWTLFVLATVTTIASYMTSQFAQVRQLEISERYNIDHQDNALSETNWPNRLTVWASYAAGVCFLLAIVGSTLFVGLNLDKGSQMTKGFAKDGAPAPILQNITGTTVQKGAPAPIINKIPLTQPAPSAPASAPASAPVQPSQSSSGSK